MPKTTYKEDKTLKAGETVTEREARAGQTASACRIYYKDGKEVKTEEIHSSYYPSIGAIIRRGPEKETTTDKNKDDKKETESSSQTAET